MGWHVGDAVSLWFNGIMNKNSQPKQGDYNVPRPMSATTVTPSGVSASHVGSASGSFSGSGYDSLAAISDANNAFNLQQVREVNAFNAAEAQKNRDWQERMSNTAHQREVADLKAAGLNPILSALGGQGAYTGSGATASGQKAVADNTLGNGLISMMSAMIAASSAQSVANTYAAASMYSADKQAGSQANYHKVLKEVANINNNNANARSMMNALTSVTNALVRVSGYE